MLISLHLYEVLLETIIIYTGRQLQVESIFVLTNFINEFDMYNYKNKVMWRKQEIEKWDKKQEYFSYISLFSYK